MRLVTALSAVVDGDGMVGDGMVGDDDDGDDAEIHLHKKIVR